MRQRLGRLAHSYGYLVVLGVVVVVAMLRRAGGFTSTSLWFDDAWAALPSHESLTTALHMSVSTPLWTLMERSWILLHPHVSWWAQIPSFVFSLVATVLLYPMLRRAGVSPRASSLATALFAVNPIMTTYATRVKPYTLEIVCAEVLIIAAMSYVSQPRTKTLVLLGLASFLSVAISFGILVTVVALWLVVLWLTRGDRRTLSRTLLGALAAGAASLALVAPYVLGRPPSLGDNWINRGYMLPYDSVHHWIHNAVAILSGFPHAVLNIGWHLRYDAGHGHHYALVYALASLFALATLAVFAVWWRLGSRGRGPAAVVSLVIPLSLAAAVADIFPFGDGRTDMVTYPVFYLMGTVVLVAIARRWRISAEGMRRMVVALVTLVTLSAGAYFVANKPAVYPEVDMRAILTQVEAQWRPGDVIVVPAFLTYPWANDSLTSWRLVLGGSDQWPQGFRVVSTDARVLFPVAWTGNDAQLEGLHHHFSRVWYVGYTAEAWSPRWFPAKWSGVPMRNYTSGGLEAAGWRVAWFGVHATNCYATPMTYQPTKAPDPFL